MEGTLGARGEAAEQAGWSGPEQPGPWVRVERCLRDGHHEVWWALEVVAGPYGPQRPQRAVVATTDLGTLPDHATWYLTTNLVDADLAELVRLYGLRNWVEQSYKHVRHRLGWGQYQVRSDLAIRRHWAVVCCAFSFCWQAAADLLDVGSPPVTVTSQAPTAPAPAPTPRRGENQAPDLAPGPAAGPRLADPLGLAAALVGGVVVAAPAPRVAGTARSARAGAGPGYDSS